MTKFIKFFTFAVFFLLAACGGGGGSPGDSAGGAAAADFIYKLDKTSLSNSGLDEALLTITTLDAKNNPVSAVQVTVSVDSGVYTPITKESDDAGLVTGKISIGNNKSNRTINVDISAGGKSKKLSIPVTGSQIAINVVPAVPEPGTSASLTVKVTDVNGSGIVGAPIKMSGTLGFSQSLITDSGGNATAQISAVPQVAGIYTVTGSASGVTLTREVQVLASGGGSIPDAEGVISAAVLAIVPNTIPPNVSGSTINRAGLRAVFQNSANQAIKNVRARFEIVPPVLGSGEHISNGSATMYSDANGEVVADYIAGTRSSPTNGVVIRVCYGSTDAEISNGACPNFRLATMTVASQPLSITLGDNNLLQRGQNELTYIKKFDIAVSDSAGIAIPNANISASVDLLEYGKGPYAGPRVWCLNEDANRNGFLDVGEDVDGDGKLSPRKADIVLSYVGEKATGSNGRATIQVEYPQNVATWLYYAVKVTTSVAGSEGIVEKRYFTSFIEGDDKNGSFLTPPYGFNGCMVPN